MERVVALIMSGEGQLLFKDDTVLIADSATLREFVKDETKGNVGKSKVLKYSLRG